jgi:hypothetical protein
MAAAGRDPDDIHGAAVGGSGGCPHAPDLQDVAGPRVTLETKFAAGQNEWWAGLPVPAAPSSCGENWTGTASDTSGDRSERRLFGGGLRVFPSPKSRDVTRRHADQSLTVRRDGHRPFPARELSSDRVRNESLIRARVILHPGGADGQNRAALQARIAVTVGRDRQHIPPGEVFGRATVRGRRNKPGLHAVHRGGDLKTCGKARNRRHAVPRAGVTRSARPRAAIIPIPRAGILPRLRCGLSGGAPHTRRQTPHSGACPRMPAAPGCLCGPLPCAPSLWRRAPCAGCGGFPCRPRLFCLRLTPLCLSRFGADRRGAVAAADVATALFPFARVLPCVEPVQSGRALRPARMTDAAPVLDGGRGRVLFAICRAGALAPSATPYRGGVVARPGAPHHDAFAAGPDSDLFAGVA